MNEFATENTTRGGIEIVVACVLAGLTLGYILSTVGIDLRTPQHERISTVEVQSDGGLKVNLPASPGSNEEDSFTNYNTTRGIVWLTAHVGPWRLVQFELPPDEANRITEELSTWSLWIYTIAGGLFGLMLGLAFRWRLSQMYDYGTFLFATCGAAVLLVAFFVYCERAMKNTFWFNPLTALVLILPLGTFLTFAALSTVEGRDDSLARGTRLGVRIVIGIVAVIGFVALIAALIARALSR